MTLRRGLALAPVLALVAGILSVLAIASPAQASGVNCSDFSTQKAAQIWFLNHGGPWSDPEGLDSEGDGIACESNPCPCYYSKSAPKPVGIAPAPKPKPAQVTQFARITHVVDGDTVDVRLHNGHKARIRMIGIDTPEVYGGVECGGPQASAWLKRNLPVGTRVRLDSDTSQDLVDRYKRLLRYVTKIQGNRDMNRAQIRAGNATVYVYDNTPFHRTSPYRSAQTQAKRAHRGIWNHC